MQLNFDINIEIIKNEFISLTHAQNNYETLLNEDMFQAKYSNYIIDSGWYEYKFITFLIKNHDWDEPEIKIISTNINHCLIAIDSIIFYLKKLEEKAG